MPRRTTSLPGAAKSRRTSLPVGAKNGGQPVARAKPAWPELRSQLAAIVEHSNDAIFSRTFDGTIMTWNAAAERIFGYAAEEIIGKTSWVLVPPDGQDEFRKLVARLRRGQVVEHFETERVRKDGGRIHVSLTLSPIRDSSRRIVGFSTIARDVTEQGRLREALARRERELDDLFEEASVGLLLVSPEGVVLRSNEAFRTLVACLPPLVVNQSVRPFFLDPPVADDLLHRLANRETVHNLATEFLTAKADIRHVLIDADALWEKGRLVHSRWFVRDISRRRQLERQLLESSDQERRAFAQELHDGLGQQLGGVAYLTNVLRESLAEREAPEAGSAARIFELVRQAIEDTRRMARGLSPIREAPEGLMEALRELATQTSELQGIGCRLHCRKPMLMPDPAIAGHLYRIAQEAVNNAVKHARPRTIHISLRNTKGRLRLVITDDGKGIGLLSPNRKGLGLHTMQYRAGLIRGTLDVAPRRPRGTEVVCTIPLPLAPARKSRG